jgi:hypothetical protein
LINTNGRRIEVMRRTAAPRGYARAKPRKRCYYCGIRFGRYYSDRPVTDHVEPLSRGGEDSRRNVIQCCQGCNLSKRNRFLLEWVWSGCYHARQGEYGLAVWRNWRTGKWPRWLTADEILEVKRNALRIPLRRQRKAA